MHVRCRHLVVGFMCINCTMHIMHEQLHTVCAGSKEEMDDEFIQGTFTPPFLSATSKKHPLSDASNGNPAQKRKTLLSSRVQILKI